MPRRCQRTGGRDAVGQQAKRARHVWFTEEEKAFLDELARTEHVTPSKALREGAQLYFEDAATKLGADEGLEARPW